MNCFQNLSLIALTVALSRVIVAVALVAFLVGGWWLDEKAGLRFKGPVQNVRIK